MTAVAAYNLMPAQWGTPVIESVFLPAHAATSGASLHDPCEVVWVSGYQDSGTVVVKVKGYVTPPTANLPTTIVVTGNPGASATATATTTTGANGNFEATLTLTTATGLGSVNATTTVLGADGSANCSVDISQRGDGNSPENCSEASVVETWEMEVSYDPSRDPLLTLHSDGTVSGDGIGTWSMNGNTVTIIITLTEGSQQGMDIYIGTLPETCDGFLVGTASSSSGGETVNGTFHGLKS